MMARGLASGEREREKDGKIERLLKSGRKCRNVSTLTKRLQPEGKPHRKTRSLAQISLICNGWLAKVFKDWMVCVCVEIVAHRLLEAEYPAHSWTATAIVKACERILFMGKLVEALDKLEEWNMKEKVLELDCVCT